MRNHLAGTAQRPRLAVFRSNNHMYAQIIDDTVGNTLVSASTLDKDIKAELEKTNNVDAAAKLGTVIAKKALSRIRCIVRKKILSGVVWEAVLRTMLNMEKLFIITMTKAFM